MLQPILFSALAGILGTGLGGAVGVLFAKSSDRLLAGLLAFASGLMVGISCFDLVPEALMFLPIPDTAGGILLGALIVLAMGSIADWLLARNQKKRKPAHTGAGHRRALMRSGYIMLLAISLHNLPEGLAIGAGSEFDPKLGLTIALLIALHDVPEGMSISVPLCAGGMGKGRAVLLTALSGATTLIGGMLGAALGTLTNEAVALSLCVAAGAMILVVFYEMLPEVFDLDKSRTATLLAVAGLVFGMIAVSVIG